MQRQTNIAETIDTTADKERYDSCAKNLLAFKIVEAWILKSCIKEFYPYSVEYITEHCLPGVAEISKHAVHQDQLDKDERTDGDSKLTMMNSESSSVKEGTVYFDARFTAVVPNTKEPIALIINIEIQNENYPGYELVTRGLYYCARMISEQHGTVFTGEHYEKLRKVHSIWICPQVAKKRQYSMFHYGMTERAVIGKPYVSQEAYDLMEVIILNLGENEGAEDSNILDFLGTLFSVDKTPQEKKEILSEKYNIAMTKELESEVQNMCNLSDAIERRGEAKIITNMYKNGFSVEQIASATDKTVAEVNMILSQGEPIPA